MNRHGYTVVVWPGLLMWAVVIIGIAALIVMVAKLLQDRTRAAAIAASPQKAAQAGQVGVLPGAVSTQGGDHASSGAARAILEERLARGEIDLEEFAQRVQALGGSVGQHPSSP